MGPKSNDNLQFEELNDLTRSHHSAQKEKGKIQTKLRIAESSEVRIRRQLLQKIEAVFGGMIDDIEVIHSQEEAPHHTFAVLPARIRSKMMRPQLDNVGGGITLKSGKIVETPDVTKRTLSTRREVVLEIIADLMRDNPELLEDFFRSEQKNPRKQRVRT